jgi:hypothetical protein
VVVGAGRLEAGLGQALGVIAVEQRAVPSSSGRHYACPANHQSAYPCVHHGLAIPYTYMSVLGQRSASRQAVMALGQNPRSGGSRTATNPPSPAQRDEQGWVAWR